MLFLVHVRHINPVKIHRERSTKNNRKLPNDLDLERLRFPVREIRF